MAGRGRTSFQKRQKEQLRAERRQAKAARKEARKADKGSDADIEPLSTAEQMQAEESAEESAEDEE